MKNRKWNRILKLADFVEVKPRKRFNFGSWVGKNWKGAKDLSCGTTACALGWATAMPLFRRLGLHLFRSEEHSEGYVMAGSNDAIMKSEDIFGISVQTFVDLFYPSEGGRYFNCEFLEPSTELTVRATPKQWAKHARKIVKQLEAGKIE